MLTKFDEMTCHQVVSTFDHPETSDRAWTEKLWCNVHDTKGELVLATGFGVYPNRNVLDGYGCVNIGNREQYNMRPLAYPQAAHRRNRTGAPLLRGGGAVPEGAHRHERERLRHQLRP